MPATDKIADIEARNALRREAHLPLLSIAAELRRLKTLQRQTEFEAFYEAERPKYNHLWSRPNLGWMGGHIIWKRVRAQMRAEFEGK